ncbi:ATPdependent RNA helicase [Dionaea muscipula]
MDFLAELAEKAHTWTGPSATDGIERPKGIHQLQGNEEANCPVDRAGGHERERKRKVEKENVKGVNATTTFSGEFEQDSPVDGSPKESKDECKDESQGKIEALSEEPYISNYKPKLVPFPKALTRDYKDLKCCMNKLKL